VAEVWEQGLSERPEPGSLLQGLETISDARRWDNRSDGLPETQQSAVRYRWCLCWLLLAVLPALNIGEAAEVADGQRPHITKD
jgi:hypothetical protein